MFWNGNHTSGRIDTLLGNENVSLSELMDEEDILQECKTQNKKLTDFLIQPTVLNELVSLITEEPPEDLDISSRYRYASIACEILTSDISLICEKISDNTLLMDKLCSFIDRPPPLNPLLASFFNKAIEKLLVKKFEQDYYTHQMICLRVLEYFKNRQTFLPSLLTNIGTSAIMDTLRRMISIEADVRENMIEWLESQGCIEQLIQILCGTHKTISHCPIKPIPYVDEKKPKHFIELAKSSDLETELSNVEYTQQGEQNGSANLTFQNDAIGHMNGSNDTEKDKMAKLRRRLLIYQSTNASQLLYDIIQSEELLHRGCLNLGVQTLQTDPNIVQIQLDDIKNQESENVINLLLESIFTTPMETRQIALINGMQVLIALLNDMTSPACSEITEKLQKTDISDATVSGFVQADGDNTRVTTNVDKSPQGDNAVRQRAAKAVAPHLPLLHQALLVAPLHNMSPCSHIPEPVGEARLSITRLIPELIKLESIEVAEVIVTLGTLGIMLDMFFKHQWNNFLHANVERTISLAIFSKVAGSLYLKHLIFECNLLDRLLTAWENNERKVGIKITRQGYMGHVIQMLEEFFKLFENDLQLLDNMGVPEEMKTRWQSFVENKLKAVLEQHAGYLGGFHPALQVFENNTDFNEFVETTFPTDSEITDNSNFEDLGDNWGQEPFIESLEACNLILDSHSPWASEEEAASKSDQSGWANFNFFDSSAEPFTEDLHPEDNIKDLSTIEEIEGTITAEEEPHSKNNDELSVTIQEEQHLKNNEAEEEQPVKNIDEVEQTTTVQEDQTFKNWNEFGTTDSVQEGKLSENNEEIKVTVLVEEGQKVTDKVETLATVEDEQSLIKNDEIVSTNTDQKKQQFSITDAEATNVILEDEHSGTQATITKETSTNSAPVDTVSEMNADTENTQRCDSSQVPREEIVIDNSSSNTNNEN